METVFIYALTDPITDEIKYIGKSKCPSARLKQHLRNKTDTPMGRWIRKLRDAGLKPQIEIIEDSTEPDWVNREKFWIAYCKESGIELCNSNEGGAGSTEPSAEAIEHMRIACKGRKPSEKCHIAARTHNTGKPAWNRGIPISDEVRKKISEKTMGRDGYWTGKRRSVETVEKIRQKNTGNPAWNRGKKMPENVGKAVSKAHKGKPLSAEHRAKLTIALIKRWEKYHNEQKRQSENTP